MEPGHDGQGIVSSSERLPRPIAAVRRSRRSSANTRSDAESERQTSSICSIAGSQVATDARGLDRLDREGIATVLRATYGDVGWETPRVLAGLDDDSLHVDQIAQVRLPTWHRGRVAVLGDAAWCAGPFGTGTTSALAGAYVLAGELGATPEDVPGAFRRYERILRPQTDQAQTVVPRHGHPRTEWHRRLLRAGLRVAGGPLGSALARVGVFDPSLPVDVVALPEYPARATVGS